METYNYDAAAVPEGDADTTPAAAPETDAAAAGTSDTAQSGFSSQPPVILTYPDSSSNDLQVSPGFGPYGDVMPSLPSNNHSSPNTGGCINCGGSNWKPSPNGALWTWGILSPFFSTSSEIAHLRFYNAASIREPIDIYLNGRLVVSDLDYMNYTRYMHIIPGIYQLTVYRRTNPASPSSTRISGFAAVTATRWRFWVLLMIFRCKCSTPDRFYLRKASSREAHPAERFFHRT